MGETAMVADGQWAVDVKTAREGTADTVVEGCAADGRRVEMTAEALDRAVKVRFRGTQCDKDAT